ncbi:2-iminobutanoate/2-iminopropanoate deaminase (plasmid) [Pseudosulfitobacter pseudonitzschiae]|uniref:2-iminobutanoate/2-iminopropanoate deaminase n=1 Tax=Pseudosulfitobacter pseudonitzschiae TaxID=1402135 RepID=A0A221K9C7_9RHOB|nr:RidA family protein [Pseudosulfitobacter pseudonitzschiae]ASM75618.1 2-iminobutanoate/2-iminopropanoate deaminase [Pseudosulfitobacter pseudonitzschiae]
MTLERLTPGPRMSQAVCIGDIAFLAGQVPNDLAGDITAQTHEVLNKIDAVMAELGGSKADVASVQVWLADMADFQGMNAVWDAWVDPANPPARATGGMLLARQGMRVEMIVVARVPH